ncbi:MAG: cache domain-containing protein, partial [Bacillota bacterium]
MKTKWFHSIRTKIVVVYIAVVSVVLIGMSAGFRNMLQEEAVSRSTALCRNTLQNISAAVDAKLLLADDYRYTIHSDGTMTDALAHILPLDLRITYQQYVYQTNLRKGLVSYSHTSSFVDSFSLYSYQSDTLFSSESRYFIVNDVPEEDCALVQAYAAAGDNKWVCFNDGVPLVVNFQPIFDFYTGKRLGLFSVNISLQTIAAEISTHTPQADMQIWMVDSMGNTISASDTVDPAIRAAVSGSVIPLNGADYLVVTDASDYTGWTFYALLPMSTVLSS